MQGVLSCGYEEVLAIPVHKPAKPAEPEIILTGMRGFLSRKLGIDPWGQILIVLLIILFGGVIEGFRLANSKIDDLQIPTTIDNKLRPVATEVHGLSERMSTIEGELKILLTQKSLAAAGKYAREGKTELAVKASQQLERSPIRRKSQLRELSTPSRLKGRLRSTDDILTRAK